MFQEIKDQKHPLHYLLPTVKVSNSQMVLWPTYPYQLPLSKSSPYGRDFIPYSISLKFYIRPVIVNIISIIICMCVLIY